MADFYVNSNGSATAPYETRAKGIATLKALIDAAVIADTDTIYFSDDGQIDDSGAALPDINYKVLLKPDPLNTGMPEIKVSPTLQAIYNASQFYDISGIKFIKEADTVSGNFVHLAATTWQKCLIEGNEFEVIGGSVSNTAIGVEINDAATFADSDGQIKRNKFVNVDIDILIS